MDNRFPRAPLFQLRWCPPLRIGDKTFWTPVYTRFSNCAALMLPFLLIYVRWRMPWAPQAAYSMGWDAAFRQFHGLAPKGEEK